MKKKILLAVLGALFPLTALAKIENSSEAGLVITSGNTETTSYNVKSSTKYLFEPNELQLSGSYLEAKQKGVLSAEYWRIELRYERELTPKWSGLLAQAAEGNIFAGYQQRYNSDVGGKYYFHKEKKELIWFAEAGYRFTREHANSGIWKSFQKGRIFSEAEKYWGPTTSTKLWVEYLPNFTLHEAWQLNGELSISSALSDVFSVKTAYLVKYSNLPATSTALKRDTTFTTSLVAKF